MLNIYSGGSVGITSIGANASMTLNSNANWSKDNFSTITLNSKAQFIVQSGANLHDMTLSSQGSFVIGSGGSANNIIIDGGSLYNNNATTFQNITFGENGGTLGFTGNYLLNQASLSNYSFNNNATLELGSGAVLSGAILSGGTLIIGNSGTSIKNIINGGTLILNYSSAFLSANPNLSNTIFGINGGTLILKQKVLTGGELAQLNALNSKVNISLTNAEEMFKGGGLSNVNITSQYITLSGNSTSIYDGYINNDAHIEMHYGRASNITINSNGEFNLYNSGYANNIVLNNGSMNVFYTTSEKNGASLDNITINSGAVFNASSASIGELTFNNGIVNIIDGSLTGAQINSTSTFYASNTRLRRVKINSNGVLNLTNTKNAQHNDNEDITINNGGTLNVINADNAINPLITNTVINSGGIFNISNYNYNVTPIVYSTFISNGGVFNANNTYISDTIILSGGTLNLNSGLTVSTTVNSGATLNISNNGSAYMTFVSSGAIMNVVSGGVIDQTTIVPEGTLSIGYHGVLLNATINSNASVVIGSGGTLSGIATLEQGGYIYINTSTGGIINLLNSTSIPTMRSYEDLASNSNDMAKIVISGTGSATTVISGFSGTNPDDSNTITLENINKNDVTQVSYPDADHVTFTLNNGSTITLNVVGIGNYGYELSSDPNGNLTFEVCFLAGTMIETIDGFRAVETIKIGNIVMTYDPLTQRKIARPVTAVAHQNKIVNTSLIKDEAGYPVRVLKNALANNVPDKDLLITSEHCLFFNGKLVPVRMLVNGYSIFYDTTITNYEYYHIETDEHSILIADGTFAESYLDTGNRHIFADPNMATNIIHTKKRWNYAAAAPLAVTRDFVEPIYQEITNRIQHNIMEDNSDHFNIIQDDGLYLITNKGVAITHKTITADKKVSFILPPETTGVWIVSRASRPCDVIGSFIDDRRYLGVLIGDIQLHSEKQNHTIDAHLTEASLSGWDVQEAVPCRWTNGKAFLPLSKTSHSKLKQQILTLQILSDHSYIINQKQLIKKNA